MFQLQDSSDQCVPKKSRRLSSCWISENRKHYAYTAVPVILRIQRELIEDTYGDSIPLPYVQLRHQLRPQHDAVESDSVPIRLVMRLNEPHAITEVRHREMQNDKINQYYDKCTSSISLFPDSIDKAIIFLISLTKIKDKTDTNCSETPHCGVDG